MARAWHCLEVDCGTVVTADDDQQLVVAVNRHMAAAHESFELEEVVLDAASDAPRHSERGGLVGAGED